MNIFIYKWLINVKHVTKQRKKNKNNQFPAKTPYR